MSKYIISKKIWENGDLRGRLRGVDEPLLRADIARIIYGQIDKITVNLPEELREKLELICTVAITQYVGDIYANENPGVKYDDLKEKHDLHEEMEIIARRTIEEQFKWIDELLELELDPDAIVKFLTKLGQNTVNGKQDGENYHEAVLRIYNACVLHHLKKLSPPPQDLLIRLAFLERAARDMGTPGQMSISALYTMVLDAHVLHKLNLYSVPGKNHPKHADHVKLSHEAFNGMDDDLNNNPKYNRIKRIKIFTDNINHYIYEIKSAFKRGNIYEAILHYAKFGEFLQKIFPGKDTKGIQEKLSQVVKFQIEQLPDLTSMKLLATATARLQKTIMQENIPEIDNKSTVLTSLQTGLDCMHYLFGDERMRSALDTVQEPTEDGLEQVVNFLKDDFFPNSPGRKKFDTTITDVYELGDQAMAEQKQSVASQANALVSELKGHSDEYFANNNKNLKCKTRFKDNVKKAMDKNCEELSKFDPENWKRIAKNILITVAGIATVGLFFAGRAMYSMFDTGKVQIYERTLGEKRTEAVSEIPDEITKMKTGL